MTIVRDWYNMLTYKSTRKKEMTDSQSVQSILSNKRIMQELINESNSISECLRKIGARPQNNIKLFKNWCAIHEIDLKPIQDRTKKKRIESLKSGNLLRRIPNEEIFIKDSKYTKSETIKTRMVEDLNVKYECNICQISHWNGTKLSLQLDHINGDHTDNRLSNLRLLCPNCHSQTNTFCSKNRTKKHLKQCIYCGKRINYSQTGNRMLCRSKVCISRAKKSGLSLPELGVQEPKPRPQYRKDGSLIVMPSKIDLMHSLIESNLIFTRVCKKYGVSDNAVRKWCKKYEIPTKRTDLKDWLQSQNTISGGGGI